MKRKGSLCIFVIFDLFITGLFIFEIFVFEYEILFHIYLYVMWK